MRLKSLLPVHYVHHVRWSFGYLLLPWFPRALGWFTDYGFRVVRGDFHDCTGTGVY